MTKLLTGAKRSQKQRELAEAIAIAGTNDPTAPGLSELLVWILTEYPMQLDQEAREKPVEHPTERDGLPLFWLLGRWTERTSVSVETRMSTGYSRIPGDSTSTKDFAYIEAWSNDVEPHLGATVFLYDRSSGEATKVELVPGSLAPIERMVVRVEYRVAQKPVRIVNRTARFSAGGTPRQ